MCTDVARKECYFNLPQEQRLGGLAPSKPLFLSLSSHQPSSDAAGYLTCMLQQWRMYAILLTAALHAV